MSFTMSAPAARAASATAAFEVSMEIQPSHSSRMAEMTGAVRWISSPVETVAAPGRVDSPPMSMIAAPSRIKVRA